MLNQKLMGKTGEEKQFVEDLFSTYLYTGNGSTQTINNGIDLAGKGGMVWCKRRSDAGSNFLYDTARGSLYGLNTDTTNAQGSTLRLSSFDSSGFSVTASASGAINGSGFTYASWTFRKAPKFFDVVTYTGNGVAGRQISHSLGVAPGMIITKATSTSENWCVWHRNTGINTSVGGLSLNTTSPAYLGSNVNASSYISSTTFSPTIVSDEWGTPSNTNGVTYVAYLFAHDTTTDGLIQCGSFTTDGSGNASVNLGWEPQYILVKSATGTGGWQIYDTMRGLVVNQSQGSSGTGDSLLQANTSGAEVGYYGYDPTSTGFIAHDLSLSQTYIYMAIRRGPMRTPTDGTKVFAPLTASSSINTVRNVGFPTDMCISKGRTDSSYGSFIETRLIGFGADGYTSANCLKPSSTSAEASTGNGSCIFGVTNTTAKDGNFWDGYSTVWHHFRRAPGFFDVVCYTGTGSARTVNHNLGVAPELMIVKTRSNTTGWFTYSASLGATNYLRLERTDESNAATTLWNDTTPTSTVFTVGNAPGTNASGATFVAYLFASCPGVSKVGSYTGNGSSQTINCGFSGGARFVLIKRTDSTGDWYVWDTARGIVSGNDPHLSLNTTAAEVTSNDTIDPDSSGFVVNQVAATNVNVNAATYIYLAIA